MTSAHPLRHLTSTPSVSSFCAANGCVGVAISSDGVAVVDTKDTAAAPLRFTRDEWTAFVAGVKAGEFDVD